MPELQTNVSAFIQRWKASSAAERANYTLLLSELCDVLLVPRCPFRPPDSMHGFPAGFRIVRAIVREVVDVSRIALRDVKSYCGILLDDNNRKPICRLHFNTSQKYIEIFDVEGAEKIAIDSVDDIYGYATRLKAAIQSYEIGE